MKMMDNAWVPSRGSGLPWTTGEYELLRDQVRRFVEEEIKPCADRWEEDGFVPRPVLRRMGELGFFGIRYPAEYGGAEMDAVASTVFAEELGRSTYGGAADAMLVHSDMASMYVFHDGTKAQRARWMPGIVSGEVITAVAITEPDAGSDVKAIHMRATREGDSYVLNGTKLYITNGVHADLYCVAAKTDPSAGSNGITMFLVEKGTPGFSVARELDKHGWRSSDTAELVFDGCRIPAESVLGAEGQGFYSIMRNFQNERLVLAAMAIGTAEAAIDMTLAWVKARRAFGGALWDLQAIRQRLAMLSAKVEASRQFLYATAWRMAADQDCMREISMLKAICGELVNEVVYACVQYHGAMGVMRESPIERITRDARILSIAGGATEVMLEVVASMS
ncbi:acyl-CoA dehydrogenase family protein [Mesorhizobium opportunistum]|uniref:Acyl-CoA dehydrogenase family protein n=2 Tax=Mesorhizobium TaxID=68287 RepID=A0ABV1YNM6_9HYPH|nr:MULTISPECIES: acyl-CoA dehydrogenase family protein [Mesorhizobium]TIN90965.1 MAG: acyl-CoA dehydrogenase [Mesorhizobium sp.]TJU97600.1 MAG: acyl-CoA dehydrogenase [Mesorhizobium sp.]TJV13615.1 MAG: acyl-CoA dehydrogenase [Mesorhizobium sp.]UQS64310.1 acyl-CoA dehydrogenase family protein [Mesorhizobium opportunistum]WJI39096.1 acyl-CoA dehydrogenase family protein [Mesorhizobium opportunistum]